MHRSLLLRSFLSLSFVTLLAGCDRPDERSSSGESPSGSRSGVTVPSNGDQVAVGGGDGGSAVTVTSGGTRITIANGKGVKVHGSGHVQVRSDSDCVEAHGDVIAASRAVGRFDRIRIHGSPALRFTQGSPAAVTVRAPAPIAELITTNVEGAELVVGVRAGACYQSSAPIEVDVTAPELDRVAVLGSGDFIGTAPVKADRIDLRVEGSGDMSLEIQAARVAAHLLGSGDMSLHGKAAEIEFEVRGSGDIAAKDLAGSRVGATVAGTGSIELRASDELTAHVQGTGNIRYWGKPGKVAQKVTGTGDIEAGE